MWHDRLVRGQVRDGPDPPTPTAKGMCGSPRRMICTASLDNGLLIDGFDCGARSPSGYSQLHTQLDFTSRTIGFVWQNCDPSTCMSPAVGKADFIVDCTQLSLMTDFSGQAVEPIEQSPAQDPHESDRLPVSSLAGRRIGFDWRSRLLRIGVKLLLYSDLHPRKLALFFVFLIGFLASNRSPAWPMARIEPFFRYRIVNQARDMCPMRLYDMAA